MVTWTANTGNFTPHPRSELCCCVLPLNAGDLPSWNPANQSIWIDDGQGGWIEGEAFPMGMPYRDGSIRRLRAYFPHQIAAGTNPGSSYPHSHLLLDRDIPIETRNTPNSLPSFTQHANVDLVGTTLELITDMGWGHPTPASYAERSVSFTLAQGSVLDYRDGSLHPSSAVEELDVGSRLARRFMVRARMFPELQGGDPREPAIWIRLLVEIPSSAGTDVGRFPLVFYEVGNGLITNDSATHPEWPRRMDSQALAIHAKHRVPPRLRITGPQAYVHLEDVFHPSRVASGATTTVELMEADPANDHADMSWGMILLGMISLYYDGGAPNQAERDTASAISYADGDHPRVDMVSGSWTEKSQAVGPYKALPTGIPQYWDTFETQFRAAGWFVYNGRDYYRARARWAIEPNQLYGSITDTGSGGTAWHNRGAGHLHWTLATGFPDLRSARISSWLDGNRRAFPRYLDCSPLRPWEARHRESRPNLWTNCLYYHARPMDAGSLAWADHLGIKVGSNAKRISWSFSGQGNGWEYGHRQNHECRKETAFTTMVTGDLNLLHGMAVDLTASMLPAHPIFEEFPVGTEAVWGVGQPREERLTNARISLVTVIDSAEHREFTIQQLARRIHWLWERGQRTEDFAYGRSSALECRADMNRAMAWWYRYERRPECMLHGSFPGQGDNKNRPRVYYHWMLNLCVGFYWGLSRVLEDVDPAQFVGRPSPYPLVDIDLALSRAREAVKRIGAGSALHGFQVTDRDTHGLYRIAWELNMEHGADGERSEAFDVVANPDRAVNYAWNPAPFTSDIVGITTGAQTTIQIGGGDPGISARQSPQTAVVAGATGQWAETLNGTHDAFHVSAGNTNIRLDVNTAGLTGSIAGATIAVPRATHYAWWDRWRDPVGSVNQTGSMSRAFGSALCAHLADPSNAVLAQRIHDIYFDTSPPDHAVSGITAKGHLYRWSGFQPGDTGRVTPAWLGDNLALFAMVHDEAFSLLLPGSGVVREGRARGLGRGTGSADPTGSLFHGRVVDGDPGVGIGYVRVQRIRTSTGSSLGIGKGEAEGELVPEAPPFPTPGDELFGLARGFGIGTGEADGERITSAPIVHNGATQNVRGLGIGSAFARRIANGKTTASLGRGEGRASGELVGQPSDREPLPSTGDSTIGERTGSPAERDVQLERVDLGENRTRTTRVVRLRPGLPPVRPIVTGRP